MKNVLNMVAALPLLMSSAMAASTSVSCRTLMGTRSVSPVPRTTTTTTGARPTKTVIVQSTVTSSEPVTTTSTVYVTRTSTVTDATQTDVFFTTTTSISYRVIPVTSTVTTTSTSTTTTSTTSTSVIPTTQGFAPIADTINAGPQAKRDILGGSLAQRAAKKVSKNKQVGILAASRPVAVSCTKSVAATRTVTVTRTSSAKTSIVRNTVTATATSTITTTSTIITGDVTSTSTATVTSTVNTVSTTYAVSTVTTTTTQTNTVVGPTQYAACNAQNYFGPGFTSGAAQYFASDVLNNGAGKDSTLLILSNGASTVEACCNACQQSSACENFAFRAQNLNCFLLTHAGEVCPNQYNHPNFITSTAGQDDGSGLVVGNGYCGYAYSGTDSGASLPVNEGSGFNGQA